MITAIEVENFKGIGERQRIEFKPITLLFGPNSAGKSTILHSILYAQEVFGRRNYDAGRTVSGGEFVDLGGFCNFVHNRDRNRAVVIKVELDMREVDWPEYFSTGGELDYTDDERLSEPVKTSYVEVTLRWSETLGRPYCAVYEVGINGERFGALQYEPGKAGANIEINPDHPIWGDLKYRDNMSFAEWLNSGEVDPKAVRSLRASIPDIEDETESAEGHEGEENADLRPETKRWPGGPSSKEDAISNIFTFCLASFNEREKIFARSLLPYIMNPIPISPRTDALPLWGKALALSFSDDDHVDRDEKILEDVSRLMVRPGEAVRDSLRQFRYLGPLREKPPRNYEPPRFPDPARWSSGIGAWDALQLKSQDLVQEVSEWLARPDRLNTGYNLQRHEYRELDVANPDLAMITSGRAFDDADLDGVAELIRQLPIRRRLALTEASLKDPLVPADVGEGISQIVPVVVSILDDRSKSQMIEQPELHVHPAVQVALGDLLIEGSGDRTGYLLIETHSEHLLLRLLRRIRETHDGALPEGVAGLEPDRLAVQYLECDAGAIRIRPLRIDETGEFLDRWPRGFFEERINEI